MKKYKSILLLKVPYCTHPDSEIAKNQNFRKKSTFRPVPSLALAALSAFIEKYKTYDYNLKSIDINIEGYTTPNTPIDTSLFTRLLCNFIKNEEYDVLALSAMYVFTVKWVDTAIELSRKYHPDAKIILGGGYPTIFPERCLKDHDVDYVVIGEGEATLLHIINKFNGHRDIEFEKKFPFAGYAFRKFGGRIIHVPRNIAINMEDLPAPAWHYLNVEKYFRNSGDNTLPIEASRGCPYRCTYCTTHLAWGRRVRYKPVEHIIKEILEIKNRYRNPVLHFIDDNMSFSKKWITDFLTKLIDLDLKLDLRVSNFSVNHLDEETIDLLVRAGVRVFGLPVESGSLEVQKRIRKNLNFNRVREVVRIMKSKKLHVHICWMIGFPGETLAQIHDTFKFARELRAHSNQFLLVLPYPGTELFNEAKNQNILLYTEDNLEIFDNRKCEFLKSEEWNYDYLQEMIYDMNIDLNFLNNPALDRIEGREYMLDYFKGLLLSLPDHIIMHIVIGYIYKLKNMRRFSENHYKKAAELFDNKSLCNTFIRYLSWDHPIINDFNQYLKIRGNSKIQPKKDF